MTCLVLLALTTSVRCGGGTAAAILDTPLNGSIIAPHASEDSYKLIFTKLGVAFAMFVLVLIACGMPVLVMTCIKRRAETRSFKLVDTPSEAVTSSGEIVHDLETPRRETYDEPNISTLNHSSPECLDSQWSGNSAGPLLQSTGPAADIPFAMHDIHRKQKNIKVWAGRITCFAAGVFLSTGNKASSTISVTYFSPFYSFSLMFDQGQLISYPNCIAVILLESVWDCRLVSCCP